MQASQPNVQPLHEATVLITGGTSGVGLATAIKFAERGVRNIVMVGRDTTRGENARQEVKARHPGVDAFFIAGDANQCSEALRLCEAAQQRFGRIDVLVNSTVGPYPPALLHNTPIESVEPMLLKQIMAPLLMSRAVLPIMRTLRGGVILNVASDAGKLATPGETVIGAAMAGIIMFSRALAIEGKRDGVRVNALTPSLIDGTPNTERMLKDPFASNLFDKARQGAQLGVAVPDDLAELIVFLASPQAARITGQAISVNGGISAA
jgi:2-hydroxycyclohexanecarboxyl-CoA dehydrogenase